MMFLLESSWRHVYIILQCRFLPETSYPRHPSSNISDDEGPGCPITSKTHRSLGSIKPFSDEPGFLGLESPRTLFDRMELTTPFVIRVGYAGH